MLHDPHRDLNLLAFRDFAASKDPEQPYVYSNRCDCACGQFAKYIGLHAEWMAADLGTSGGIWAEMNRMAFRPCAEYSDRQTWGLLRKRLDALLTA